MPGKNRKGRINAYRDKARKVIMGRTDATERKTGSQGERKSKEIENQYEEKK